VSFRLEERREPPWFSLVSFGVRMRVDHALVLQFLQLIFWVGEPLAVTD
jgi:hypothetical protein